MNKITRNRIIRWVMVVPTMVAVYLLVMSLFSQFVGSSLVEQGFYLSLPLIAGAAMAPNYRVWLVLLVSFLMAFVWIVIAGVRRVDLVAGPLFVAGVVALIGVAVIDWCSKELAAELKERQSG